MAVLKRSIVFIDYNRFLIIFLGALQINTVTANTAQEATDGELYIKQLVNGEKPQKPEYLVFTAPYRLCKGGCKNAGDNVLMKFPIYIGTRARKEYQTLYSRDYASIVDRHPNAPFRMRTTREVTTTTKCDLNLNLHVDLVTPGETVTCPTTTSTTATTSTTTSTSTTTTPTTTTTTPTTTTSTTTTTTSTTTTTTTPTTTTPTTTTPTTTTPTTTTSTTTTTTTPTPSTTTTTKGTLRMCPYLNRMCIKKEKKKTTPKTNEPDGDYDTGGQIVESKVELITDEAIEDVLKLVQNENLQIKNIIGYQAKILEKVSLEKSSEIIKNAGINQDEVQKIGEAEINKIKALVDKNMQEIQKILLDKTIKIQVIVDKTAKEILKLTKENNNAVIQDVVDTEKNKFINILDAEKEAFHKIIEDQKKELENIAYDKIKEITEVIENNDIIKDIVASQIFEMEVIANATIDDLVQVVDAISVNIQTTLDKEAEKMQKHIKDSITNALDDKQEIEKAKEDENKNETFIENSKDTTSYVMETEDNVKADDKGIDAAVKELIILGQETEKESESEITTLPAFRYFMRTRTLRSMQNEAEMFSIEKDDYAPDDEYSVYRRIGKYPKYLDS